MAAPMATPRIPVRAAKAVGSSDTYAVARSPSHSIGRATNRPQPSSSSFDLVGTCLVRKDLSDQGELILVREVGNRARVSK